MFVHTVMYKFADPSPENLAAVRERLLGMLGQIETLRSIEVGIDALRTPRSYDMVLITRFDDRAGYEAYHQHPYHQPILAEVRALLSAAAAVDFDAGG